MNTTLIKGGVIVNEGRSYRGDLFVRGEQIEAILPAHDDDDSSSCLHIDADQLIDATGCLVLPGIIDSHVHFREPGLTEKATIESESRAAAAGGVTTFFDMPNTVPQTTTLEALEEKFRIAARSSHVNYSFFFGATNDNTELFTRLDPHRIPGIKLFMGSSTGNMLVDNDIALQRIFSSPIVGYDGPLPLMVHCEDTEMIRQNMEHFCQSLHTDDPDVGLHPLIRSEEACYASTSKAVMLATTHQTRLHVAHVSTKEEIELIPADCLHVLTAEATVGHLYFSLVDYDRLGSRIKVNPAIKNFRDQMALRQALNDGRVTTIATDHAPHLLEQKQGGCARAASGMPMIKFSLPTMLELVDDDVLTIERLVELMCHNPARLFQVRRRGFLRPGYQADITVVRPRQPWTVTKDLIESRCGWSPMEGHTFQWHVEQTLCNGHLIYNKGVVDRDYIGQSVAFR